MRSSILAIAVLMSCAAQAREYKAQVIEIAPYAEIVAGQPAGLYVDFFKQLSAATSEEIKIQLVPFTRAVNDLSAAKSDFLITVARPDLEEKAQHICRPLILPSIVYSPREVFKTWDQLEGKKMIRIRGGCQDVYDKMKDTIVYVEVKSIRQGLVVLFANRGDAICADVFSIKHNLEKLGKPTEGLDQAFQTSVRDVVLYASKNVPKEIVAKMKKKCDDPKMKKLFKSFSKE